MVDVIKIVGEVGSIGVLLVVLFLVAKHGSRWVERMMDHLDAGVQAQNEVAKNLELLCGHLNGCEVNIREQSAGTARVLGQMSDQLQAHEKRAQSRHEQVLKHADERHGELMQALGKLNGK